MQTPSRDGHGEPPHLAVAESDRRRHRRHEVALIASVTTEESYSGSAVVTSISAGGAFVQAEGLLRSGERLKVDVGLGPDLGRVRSKGRVVRINRRHGAEIVFGFGVEFEDPPADLAERLELLAQRRIDAVRLDPLGFVEWPIFPGTQATSPETSARGLQVWSAGRWVDVAVPSSRPGGSGAEIDESGTLLRLARPVLESASSASPVALAYRGKMLTPPSGLPRGELIEGIRSPGAGGAVWVKALQAQMRLIGLLETGGWRLERLNGELETSLRAILRGLSEARLDLISHRESAAARSDGEERRAAIAGLDRGLAALESLVRGLSFCLEAMSAPETAHRAASKVSTPPAMTASGLWPWLRENRDALRELPPRRGALVASLLAAIVVSVAGFVHAIETVPRINARDTLTIDIEALRHHLPVSTVWAEGRRVVIELPESWVELPLETRRASFRDACTVLGTLRYTEAVAKVPGAKEVARWHDANVDILG